MNYYNHLIGSESLKVAQKWKVLQRSNVIVPNILSSNINAAANTQTLHFNEFKMFSLMNF